MSQVRCYYLLQGIKKYKTAVTTDGIALLLNFMKFGQLILNLKSGTDTEPGDLISLLYFLKGRAVAQAVSRWIPTAAARVRVRAEQVGFVVNKMALGQVFPEYFGFPCQSFHRFLQHHKHPGLAQLAIGSRSVEWTQFNSAPHYSNLIF
jgi:hypothetical protein